MKFLSSVLAHFVTQRSAARNLLSLLKFMLFLTAIIIAFSVIFHFLMIAEGQEHSWVTGFYWTLTVMSTLGFGDITFTSDMGRLFSIIVMLAGVVFLLVLLPFTIIKFLWAPWVEAETRNRTPRELPPETSGHVLIVGWGTLQAALVRILSARQRECVVVVSDYAKAMELYDEGIRVAVGDIDDPNTYKGMRVHQAELVVAANSDEVNTNIAFTVREQSEDVRIVATVDSVHSVDVLELAGSNRVLQVHRMLGLSLANWTLGGTCRANVIGRFGEDDELQIVEFSAMNTPLVGKTLSECQLREKFGLSVVGIWQRGAFAIATADAVIQNRSILVLSGDREALEAFDDAYSFYHLVRAADSSVLVIGGGRVGQTIAERLAEREIPFVVVERDPARAERFAHSVVGDAADLGTLKKASIDTAPAALVTTHDDDTNIYLTKYLRSLRPDMQILSRATRERNVSTMHRAGADFVMSHATLGANAVYNYLTHSQALMLSEGLDVFRVPVPSTLAGKTLAESDLRRTTMCSVAAVDQGGRLSINPDPEMRVPEDAGLILIGTHEGERSFRKHYGN